MSARPSFALAALAVVAVGCGSSGGTPEPVERASIAANVRAPSSTEISDADLRRVEQGTASRAFLEYWSDLQWQDWISALDRYSPGLRRIVGPRHILAALQHQAGLYRSVKPAVERESTRRSLTTVRFSYGVPAQPRQLSSTIWRKADGRWTLVFDSLLAVALQTWAQTKAQQAPDATKPTKEALKAGLDAAELQNRYLPFLDLTADKAGRARGSGDGGSGSAANPG